MEEKSTTDIITKFRESLTMLEWLQRSNSRNRYCFDCCDNYKVYYTCITFGVFLCEKCANTHKSFDEDLTKLRTMGSDEWTWQDMRRMYLGGNDAAEQFFKENNGLLDEIRAKCSGKCVAGPDNSIIIIPETEISMEDLKEKYKTKCAQLYREQLDDKVKTV